MPTKRGGRRPGPRRTPVRRRTARRRTTRRRRQRATARLGAGAAALLLAASWPTVRPHLLAVAAAGVAGALLWWLRRTDRLHRSGERRRREAEAVRAGQLSLAEVDALSWQEFERYVAGLCRRDGCRDVVVTGGSGDLGADVTATLPDKVAAKTATSARWWSQAVPRNFCMSPLGTYRCGA
ncbi:restriction endonuclease [Streptomyces diastaticus]|uniref:Restriction endonuclease n=1 Tax=Streptomyces griseus TaxID=1911 RepID=A0A380ML01_STRGR|nr:restriction endonuclease [Streptomyces griseus]SUO92928.1 Restriction endonuclease [Streptomyces griseus]